MKPKASVKTCGKLYLAGEYAVLSPGQSAILQAIPLYMEGEIQPAAAYLLDSDLFDHTASLEADEDYALIQETIDLMQAYLSLQGQVLQPFELRIRGQMGKNGRKFGIGSSGSVVILTLKALAAFYGLDLSADRLFRLAALVLIRRGDNGSMGDLACIAYEDLVYYQSFDRQALAQRLADTDLLVLLDQDWGYEIRPLRPALSCDFLVGWTQEPAISSALVQQVKSAIDETFLRETQLQVERLAAGLTLGDQEAVQSSLEAASDLLAALSPAIYTEKLAALKAAAEGLDCVAKSSGAGGGDCGLALSFNPQDSQTLIQRWQAAGLELLYQERMGS